MEHLVRGLRLPRRLPPRSGLLPPRARALPGGQRHAHLRRLGRGAHGHGVVTGICLGKKAGGWADAPREVGSPFRHQGEVGGVSAGPEPRVQFRRPARGGACLVCSRGARGLVRPDAPLGRGCHLGPASRAQRLGGRCSRSYFIGRSSSWAGPRESGWGSRPSACPGRVRPGASGHCVLGLRQSRLPWPRGRYGVGL